MKCHLFVMKIRKLCCQFDDKLCVFFPLRINILGLHSEWVKRERRERDQLRVSILSVRDTVNILSLN